MTLTKLALFLLVTAGLSVVTSWLGGTPALAGLLKLAALIGTTAAAAAAQRYLNDLWLRRPVADLLA